MFDRKYCEEIICKPQHLNININWVNQTTSKIVFGLFETKNLVHFKSFKKHTTKITLLMKLVEKSDVEARKLKATQDLQSYEFQQENFDDCLSDSDSDRMDSEMEGLGMDLKLYFDFGPTTGALLLVR